jgi:hypothetical protein
MTYSFSKSSLVPAIAYVLVVVLGGCSDRSEEDSGEPVAVAQLPAVVKTVVAAEAKGGTLKDVRKSAIDGKDGYWASVVANGREQHTLIAADGTVVKRSVGHKEDND